MELTTDAKIGIGIFVATAVIIVGGAFIAGSKQPPVEGERVADAQMYRLTREENRIVTGSDNPKVTVVEFADFQCPACAAAHPVLKQAQEHYSGRDVAFEYRHYPLPQHNYAQITAEASEAARAQGKFWEYADIVYANQADISPEKLEEFAEQVGLEVNEFKQALENGDYRDIVLADLADGRAIGVDATPSIFINGVRYRGAFSLDAFIEVIDKALED